MYRCHDLSMIPCPRCQRPFAEQHEVNAHLGEKELCEELPPGPTIGITPEMKKELKKRSRVSDPEENWRQIYLLLFPDDDPPRSPCKSFSCHANAIATDLSVNSDDKVDFNDYVELHMSRLLTQHAASILDQIPSEERAELLGVVLRCQKELWHSYNGTIGPDKPVPSDGSDTDGHLSSMTEPPPAAQFYQDPASCPVDDSGGYLMNGEYPNSEYHLSPTSQVHSVLPPEVAAQDLFVQGMDGDRPSLPHHLSYWSDSGMGSSCSCHQCHQGRWDRCPNTQNCSISDLSNTAPVGQVPTMMPITINPALLQTRKDHSIMPHGSGSIFTSAYPRRSDSRLQNNIGYQQSLQHGAWQN